MKEKKRKSFNIKVQMLSVFLLLFVDISMAWWTMNTTAMAMLVQTIRRNKVSATTVLIRYKNTKKLHHFISYNSTNVGYKMNIFW